EQARRGDRMVIQTACELSATPANPPFRLADSHVGTANAALGAPRDVVASTADRPLGRLGVANSRIDPSGHVAAWSNNRDKSAGEHRTSLESAFSSVRAWSIWSYAYAAIAAIGVLSPLRASCGRDPVWLTPVARCLKSR